MNETALVRTVNRVLRPQAEKHGWRVPPLRAEVARYLWVQSGVPSLEYARNDLPSQVHVVGALLPRPPKVFHPPDWWDQLLMAREAGLRVVAVTQETHTDPGRLVRPALAALAGMEDLLVVVAGADPRDLDLPVNARAAALIPLVLVMPHVDAFVTRGGFSDLMVALSDGVPVVAAGAGEETRAVGRRITRAGVGVHLRTDPPNPEKLRDAVRAVLDQPQFGRRAGEVRAELAAHDGPAEAAALVERLAATGQPVRRSA